MDLGFDFCVSPLDYHPPPIITLYFMVHQKEYDMMDWVVEQYNDMMTYEYIDVMIYEDIPADDG